MPVSLCLRGSRCLWRDVQARKAQWLHFSGSGPAALKLFWAGPARELQLGLVGDLCKREAVTFCSSQNFPDRRRPSYSAPASFFSNSCKLRKLPPRVECKEYRPFSTSVLPICRERKLDENHVRRDKDDHILQTGATESRDQMSVTGKPRTQTNEDQH